MDKAALPSNRSFGTLFVAVFALLGLYGWWRGGAMYRWAFALSALVLSVTLGKPDWLAPANRAWMKLAEILHRIVSPIALAIMFFGVITPMALVMRLVGRDAMKLFGIEQLNVPRSSIPAVTHVDYSARVQTVHRETNPRFHDLIRRFKALTGCPVIVNTSFNVRGEPIVCTPEDAFRCFMGTEIEVLAVGNCFLRKEEQDPALGKRYERKFDLD